MKAKLHHLAFLDLDGLPDVYVPKNPLDDGVWLRLLIGPVDEPGEESFDLLVCTPAWLARIAAERGPQFGRHHLVVDKLSFPAVTEYIQNAVASLEGKDWAELAHKLSQLARWEFDDYSAKA